MDNPDNQNQGSPSKTKGAVEVVIDEEEDDTIHYYQDKHQEQAAGRNAQQEDPGCPMFYPENHAQLATEKKEEKGQMEGSEQAEERHLAIEEAQDAMEKPHADVDRSEGEEEDQDENLETEIEEMTIQRPKQTLNSLVEANTVMKEIQMTQQDSQRDDFQIQEEIGSDVKGPRHDDNVENSEEVQGDAQKLPQQLIHEVYKSIKEDRNEAKDRVNKSAKTKVKQKMQTLSTQTISKPKKSNRIARQLYRRDLAEVWHEEHPKPPFSLALQLADEQAEKEEELHSLLKQDSVTNDKDDGMISSSLWSTTNTVVNYIISDIRKKQRSFKIGMLTILLAVGFTVFLDSAFEVAPLAFLKAGQDQLGSIDFKIVSDQGDPFYIGDQYNKYDVDPFTYPEKYVEEESFITKVLEGKFKDMGDHAEIFGFNLLKFDKFKEKLDPLNTANSTSKDVFRGFSPRWTLPTALRNIHEPTLNTSALMLIIDSAREIDLDMFPYFPEVYLGDSEIMIPQTAANFLKVDAKHKDKVEVYFDIYSLFKLVQSTIGGDFETMTEDGRELTDKEQVKRIIETYLPSSGQIIQMLKQDFGYNITDDNVLKVDIADYIEKRYNTSGLNVTLKTLDLMDYLPKQQYAFDLDDVEVLNVPINDTNSPLHGIKLKDLLDGEVELNFKQNVLKAFEAANFTELLIPLEGPLNRMLQIDSIPTILHHSFNLVKAFDRPNGKFGATLGNVALVDCHYINKIFETTYLNYFDDLIRQEPLFYMIFAEFDVAVKKVLDEMNFCNYALSVNGVIQDPVGAYMGTMANMNEKIGYAGNVMVDSLTLQSNITVSAPIQQQLAQSDLFTVYIKSIMASVVIYLSGLCTQLIYNLMIADVEEKVFEFGMLRALGFDTRNIITTISMQALIFSLPGLLNGIVFSAGLNYAFRSVFFALTNNYASYWLPAKAVIIGGLLGLLMPQLANIMPIRNALAKNLRASLDIQHRSQSDTAVSVQKLQQIGLSITQTTIATLAVALGFVSYYVVPAAFIYQDLMLFFTILNAILLLMILGLCILALLLVPPLQALLLKGMLLVFRKDRKLQPIISKNMYAHRNRNTKTAIMFAICLSFLLFAGSVFKLLGAVMQKTVVNQMGNDLYGMSFNSLTSFIDQGPIVEFLKKEQEYDGAVIGWNFASPSMNKILAKIKPDKIEKAMISDTAEFKMSAADIYSEEQDFLTIQNLAYMKLNEVNQAMIDDLERNGTKMRYLSNGDPDIVWMMYQNYTSDAMIATDRDPYDLGVNNLNLNFSISYLDTIYMAISEGLRYSHAFDTTKSVKLCIGSSGKCKLSYRGKIAAMVTKLPRYQFTAYKTAQYANQIIISETQYKELLDDFFRAFRGTEEKYKEMIKSYNFTQDIAKTSIGVKLNPNCTSERRQQIQEGVKSFFRDATTIMVDIEVVLLALQISLTLFQIFVGLVGAISMALSFFLLLVSTTQNIRENVWEYGCLRAMGFSKAQGLRAFMYEAFSIVLSAVILGSAVGVIVASLVTAQLILFFQFPFNLSFPWEILIAMIIMALATTYYAVYIPVQAINDKEISTIIKGIDL